MVTSSTGVTVSTVHVARTITGAFGKYWRKVRQFYSGKWDGGQCEPVPEKRVYRQLGIRLKSELRCAIVIG